MSRFPADHSVELLRGLTKLTSKEVHRALSARVEWLDHKISLQARLGNPIWRSYLLDELKAITQLLETLDASRGEPASTGETTDG